METIYGIQCDTDTLRETHEYQKKMQQRLQEQQPSTGAITATPMASLAAPLKGPPKPSQITRSTSASALPSRTSQQQSSDRPLEPPASRQFQQRTSGASSRVTSASTSPFITAVDSTLTQPGQLRSTTHSPAFMAKFYDVDHRMNGSMTSVPWLSLPSAASTGFGPGTPAGAGTDLSTSLLGGRRRSDVGLPSSTSAHLGSDAHDASPQQENPHPLPPQQHHLLSHQELAALSRNGSPMPLNEALPHYLRQSQRKKSTDSIHSMERSFSNPGSGLATHTAPGSPFLLPMSPSLHGSRGGPAPSGLGHGTSPSHLMFSFPAVNNNGTSTTASRPELERASSTGVLPTSGPASFFRSSTPLTLPHPLGSTHAHSPGFSGLGSNSSLTSGDRDLPPKEVHA